MYNSVLIIYRFSWQPCQLCGLLMRRCTLLSWSENAALHPSIRPQQVPGRDICFSYELFVPGARLEFIDGINVNLTQKKNNNNKMKGKKWRWRISNPGYAECRVSDTALSPLSYARFADMLWLFWILCNPNMQIADWRL